MPATVKFCSKSHRGCSCKHDSKILLLHFLESVHFRPVLKALSCYRAQLHVLCDLKAVKVGCLGQWDLIHRHVGAVSVTVSKVLGGTECNLCLADYRLNTVPTFRPPERAQRDM